MITNWTIIRYLGVCSSACSGALDCDPPPPIPALHIRIDACSRLAEKGSDSR